VIDSTGTVVDHITYSAFGQPLPSTSSVDFLFGYTGRYYDQATQLQWNQNRWYNPGIQRWMGQDPDGLGPDANPYRYCGDNPANMIDPSGLAPPYGPANPSPAGTPGWPYAPYGVPGPANPSPAGTPGYPYNQPQPVPAPQGPPAVQPTPPQPPPKPSAPYDPANDPFDPSFDANAWWINRWAAMLHPHDCRNFYNQKPSYDYAKTHWIQLPASQSIYHQHGSGNENNVKFVSPDGHGEAVFHPDGTLVTDQTNGGTYNYCFSPTGDKITNFGHIVFDVVPYCIWGNGPQDKATWTQRIVGSDKTAPPAAPPAAPPPAPSGAPSEGPTPPRQQPDLTKIDPSTSPTFYFGF
jgi:RHS repeat-associated protein